MGARRPGSQSVPRPLGGLARAPGFQAQLSPRPRAAPGGEKGRERLGGEPGT